MRYKNPRTIDGTWRECTAQELLKLRHKPNDIPYWKDSVRPTIDRRKVIYKNRPW